MKIVHIVSLLALYFLSSHITPSRADTSNFSIGQENRTCEANSDCVVITIECACLHNSTCARPDDTKKGVVASVNQTYKHKFEPLAECTDDERKQCAQAGPCAMQGQWVAQCLKHQCTPVFKASH